MEIKELLKKVSSLFPPETFLVGGFIRDYLLGREISDIDLTVKGNVKEIARKVAETSKGHLFGFKKENLPLGEVYSVITPGGLRIDLTPFEGTIEGELSRRDFTINAIGWKLEDFLKGEKVFVDPFKGLEDLKKGLIRAVKFENLLADPVRLLRAYRFAHTLNFKIEPATREFLIKNRKLLKKNPKERVLTEFLKALKKENFTDFYKLLAEDNYLETILREKIDKNKLLKLSEKLEKTLLGTYPNELKKVLNREGETFLGEFSEETLLKVLPLVYYSEGFVKSYPFGEKAQKYLLNTLKGTEILRNPPKDVWNKYLFLKKFEKYLYPIGIWSSVLNLSEEFGEILDFYLKVYRKYSKPLLDGREVINLLGIRPSPLVGEILNKLIKAQLEGKVRTKERAEEFVKSLKNNL
jgi:tRNA nucleotidyltransferase/poly(A) polymerase